MMHQKLKSSVDSSHYSICFADSTLASKYSKESMLAETFWAPESLCSGCRGVRARDVPQAEQPPQTAAKTDSENPLDGVEPPTPAFSGLTKAAKRLMLKNSKECEGAHRNPQELLLFLYCSSAKKRRILKIHFADGLATTLPTHSERAEKRIPMSRAFRRDETPFSSPVAERHFRSSAKSRVAEVAAATAEPAV